MFINHPYIEFDDKGKNMGYTVAAEYFYAADLLPPHHIFEGL